MGSIKTLKSKILESAQAAFQQKTFVKFDGMNSQSKLNIKMLMMIFRGTRDY